MNLRVIDELLPRRAARHAAQPTAVLEPYARVRGVGVSLPASTYSQETLLEACCDVWKDRPRSLKRLRQMHRSVQVESRHLALPLEATRALKGFEEANDAYIRRAVDLGSEALLAALAAADLQPSDLRHIFFVSITGIATPSIDARIAARIGLRPDIKRTPIFGLGCVAGAAGLARASDYVRAYPEHATALVSVELCSLTLQRQDASVRNLIASALFGDGAAAVVLGGPMSPGDGPRVLASRSVLYPGTEDAMGWDVTGEGFRLVLSADVPNIVHANLRRDVDGFLADHGLRLSDIESYVSHPGGPKVLRAIEAALDLDDEALAVTWDGLRRVGNLSSASVLCVLEETMRTRRPRAGSYGLMLSMGPGFCSELVLLQW